MSFLLKVEVTWHCVIVDADKQSVVPYSRPSQLETTKTDSGKLLVTTTTDGHERQRETSDVRVSLDNTSTFDRLTNDTATNDVARFSASNRSTYSDKTATASTTKFSRKVILQLRFLNVLYSFSYNYSFTIIIIVIIIYLVISNSHFLTFHLVHLVHFISS